MPVALLYGTGVLFWLALINSIIHFIFDYLRAYSIAKPAMMKYEEAFKALAESGASQEELDRLESFPVEPEDALEVPELVSVINNITSFMVLVFIIVGIINLII